MDELLAKLSVFAAFRWHRGQLLAFSGVEGQTDYEAGLVIRTTDDPAALEIVRPDSARIAFAEPPETDVIVANDFFSFRSISGRTSGCLLDAHHLLISGEAFLSGTNETIRAVSRDGRCLVGSASHFDPSLLDADFNAAFTARSRWVLDRPLLGQFGGLRRRTLFRALCVMKGQICSAEGAILHRWSTPDRWPHKDMWLWDSVFHAIGWRHVDPALAAEMIDAVFDGQRADGFVPHQLSPIQGPSAITQPPLLAYGIKLVHDTAPDIEWLRRHYAKLAAYVEWDLVHRDQDGDGLVDWLIEGDPASRSGESGMDNSPRFDFHYPTQLAAVDFNAYLALECETLAEFAARLGYRKDGALWQQRHDELCRLINQYLWSEEHQFYCDYDAAAGALSPVLSSAGFLPLICGAATPDRAEALMRHLRAPEMFGTAFPVPSIAACDTTHYAKDMWRGPSWVNVNWLIARGLERYASQGEHFVALAHALDAATMQQIERTCEAFGTFFEYFDDRQELDPPQLLRKGSCDPSNPFRQVIHDYGWTTTLYVDLVVSSSLRDRIGT
jgi:putative isomerase